MKTVVGYFGSYENAEALVGELAARCFGPDCIQIGRAAPGVRIGEERGDEEGASPAVRGYFPTEARESPFVAVSVGEQHTSAVCHLMGHHGAFHVEEKEGPAGAGAGRRSRP